MVEKEMEKKPYTVILRYVEVDEGEVGMHMSVVVAVSPMAAARRAVDAWREDNEEEPVQFDDIVVIEGDHGDVSNHKVRAWVRSQS